jgi:hypothetical protein
VRGIVPTVRSIVGLLGPARLRSAPRARGAAAQDLRPGARAATRRSASRARGPGSGSPLLRPALSTVRRARGPAGPAAPAAASSPQPPLGDGRGTCPALPGLRHAGPSPWGAQGGRILHSRSPAGRSDRPSAGARRRCFFAPARGPRLAAPPSAGRGGTCPSLSPSRCAMVVRFYKPIVTILAGINRSLRKKSFFAGLTVCQRNVTA